MKILHVNLSDRIGGACIAMNRIHTGLIQQGIDSHLLVRRLSPPDLAKNHDEIHLLASGVSKAVSGLKSRIGQQLSRWQNDPSSFYCSLNLFRNNLLSRIDDINPDIVNLHWVGGGILRIEDLPRIKQPIVWTLMDMWPFCGAEHYDLADRSTVGYTKKSRDPRATGFDWNQHTWQRKNKSWKNVPVTTVSPSQWIQQRCMESALWAGRDDCQHVVIPFGLDVDIFKPRDKSACRKTHNLHGDKPLILFGADRIESPMKGMNWLIEAIHWLQADGFPFRVAFFGRGQIAEYLDSSIETVALGHIASPLELSEIYNCADLMMVPSRLESFGQTASEAQACGIPVVCFDSSGLKDIVTHKETGYRAKCYDTSDLAAGIRWCLSGDKRTIQLGQLATQKAHTKFHSQSVASQYIQLYQGLRSLMPQ